MFLLITLQTFDEETGRPRKGAGVTVLENFKNFSLEKKNCRILLKIFCWKFSEAQAAAAAIKFRVNEKFIFAYVCF